MQNSLESRSNNLVILVISLKVKIPLDKVYEQLNTESKYTFSNFHQVHQREKTLI